MFEDKGLDCVFLETHIGMKKHRHMVYECVPLPREVGEMAPIYFKVGDDSRCMHIILHYLAVFQIWLSIFLYFFSLYTCIKL